MPSRMIYGRPEGWSVVPWPPSSTFRRAEPRGDAVGKITPESCPCPNPPACGVLGNMAKKGVQVADGIKVALQ